MPLKHLRLCPCGAIRYAGCSNACRVPSDQDPANWLPNMQDGAGEMLMAHHAQDCTEYHKQPNGRPLFRLIEGGAP